MTNPSTIVITRPLAQALPLSEKLTKLGYQVAVFPLLEIAPLPEQSELQRVFQAAIAELAGYAMVAFVSPNAIHMAMDELQRQGKSWPQAVAIAVMGEGSRAALAQHGIHAANAHIVSPTDPFRTDSETLLRELDLAALAGRDVLILRAQSGRELLADALTEQGINVTQVAAYCRLAASITQPGDSGLSKQLMSLLTPSTVWVVSSSEALRTLKQGCEKIAGATGVVKLQQVNLFVSHQRIAETAENCQFKCIRLIGSGDENLLLALQSHL